MKERIFVFDNAKVWLILMVVLGHTVIASYGSQHVGVAYIWFFRGIYTMPLFFFISGFFTKPGKVNFPKLFKGVLLPFIVFDAFYLFYEPLFHENFRLNFKVPGFSMWFLIVLFVYRLIFPYIIKIKFILPISLVVALLVGFIPWVGNEFALSRFFCFLPFYLMGYFVNNSHSLTFIKKKLITPFGLKDIPIFTILLLFWAIVLYYRPELAFYTTFNGSYKGSLMLLALRLALYASAFVIGFYVLRMFPNRETFYTKYGSRTMGVYLFHGVIVLPFTYSVFPPFEENDLLGQVMVVTVPVVLALLLFSKPVDYLVKKLF